MKEKSSFKVFIDIVKSIAAALLTMLALCIGLCIGSGLLILCLLCELHEFFATCALIFPPVFILCLIGCRRRKRVLLIGAVFLLLVGGGAGINLGINLYEDSLIIDTNPNINLSEYLPFQEDSKIAVLGHEASLRFTEEDDLPIVDGAAAVFPVYSGFVNAVYPECKATELNGDVFVYNNTVRGYELLAERQTDIFFGAYPSAEQIAYAEENGTEFIYTPIGADAFVFFVHTDNPIDSLTSEQIRKIYSGEITNWKDVGGKDEPIAAFQRNEGSGSQSMLMRFMGATEIMEPPTEMVNGFMGGIVEEVANYKSKSGSIGFSFRYYMEGIIKNPDIKLLQVDGIAPTVDNIRTGVYPITGPLYAVTWKENDNKNVHRLLDWILSPEGQEIIEKTGYAGQQNPTCD